MAKASSPAAKAASPAPSDWFRQLRPSRILIVTLCVVAASCALATWLAVTGPNNALGLPQDFISVLIAINLALLVGLAGLLTRRLMTLRRTMPDGAMRSRLQRRMVITFGLVTIIPSLIITTFSALFFHFGIKSWFDERVQIAVEESVAVAEAYLEEHKETIRADVIAMVGDLRNDYTYFAIHPDNLATILNTQTALRNLTEAIIFSEDRVIARSELSLSLVFERLPPHVLREADEGNVVILADDDNKIRALMRVDPLDSIYLLVGRVIDPRVLNHMVVAQGAVNEYRRLQRDISSIQIQFSVLFIVVVLLLLLSAIWYGIYTAIRLVVPITNLINAAERVRSGDLSAQVAVGTKKDEISALGRTFNRMTNQLEKQRHELIAANAQLDERRRFTEAVFAGVSAGVVALNDAQIVTLNNRSAALLLQDDESQSMKGMPITALIPDIADQLEKARAKPQELAVKQVTVLRKGKKLNLQVRVAAELNDAHIEGYVVTFDDITALVSAQRQAAWSDVARRIAHEIKNPLTPITLSTERLKRKYLKQLASDEDRESFLRYVETITRHVGDIGQIVEEFVAFARMPSPKRERQDMRRTIKEAVFSNKTAYGLIEHEMQLPENPVMLAYDERQIAQVLTNLLKNAAEALLESPKEAEKPYIWIHLAGDEDTVTLTLEDNGPGFPEDKLDKLTEPYVTTREKGTGLGLAIVKKQIEEHKGRLTLENITNGPRKGGARVRLTFPQH